MCRWFAYIADTEPCLLEDVLIDPQHSISKQVHEHYLPYLTHTEPGATEADTEKEITLRNRLFNADGFGAGWYTDARAQFTGCQGARPVLYHTLQQPLTDPVFRSICANTASTTVFAHVRAGSGATSINTSNNHPFAWGRYTFMHNGSVAFFAQIRVALLKEMSPAAQEQIRGTTDSEHIAMLFFTYLARRVGIHGPPVFESMYPIGEVKAALEEAITTVIRVQKAFVGQEEKDKFEASSLNIAITDGDQLLAIRFRNSASQHPPSLYYSSTAGVTLNRRFPGDPDSEEKDTARTSAAMSQSQQGVGMSVNLRAADSHGKHVIVASEPTTFRKADWTLVPRNHCVLVHEDISFEVVPVNVEF